MSDQGTKRKASEALDSTRAQNLVQAPVLSAPSNMQLLVSEVKQNVTIVEKKDHLISLLGDGRHHLMLLTVGVGDLMAGGVMTSPIMYGALPTRTLNGKITKLNVGDESIQGKDVRKLLTIWNRWSEGSACIGMEPEVDGKIPGFVWHSGNVEEFVEIVGKGSEARNIAVTKVFGKKLMVKSYLTYDAVVAVIEIEGVNLNGIPALIKAANRVLGVDKEFNFGTHTTIADVTLQLSQTLAPITSSYYGLLLTKLLETGTIEAKVEAFEKAPSARLATLLGFKRVYTSQLLDNKGKIAHKVGLSTLSIDTSVILQSLEYDPKYFESSLAVDMLCYPEDEYTVKRGRKSVPLAGFSVIAVSLLRRIIAASELVRATDSRTTEDETEKLKDDDESENKYHI